MKGISNLLSAVLLIIIVIAVSAVVASWLNSMSRTQSQKISNTASDQLGCQMSNLFIKSASFNCSLDCSAGLAHNLTVNVENSGKNDVEVESVVVRNTTGNIFTFAVSPVTISPGNDAMLTNISTDSCVSINGTIDSILVTSTNCPGNAYDELTNNSDAFNQYFTYYNCT